MRVVITGASGNLGMKASAVLAGRNDLTVTRLDRNPSGGADVVAADLTVWGDWVDAFEGADVVLHLAADPRPIASWESVQRLNVDLSFNVLRAAEEKHVGRVVFASSNWILGGYRFSRHPLTPDTPPWPVNPYGASKLFIERAGCAHWHREAT